MTVTEMAEPVAEREAAQREALEARLQAGMPVDEATMRGLALQRGLAVRDALIADGLASERLFLAAPQLRPSGTADVAWAPKATLTLSRR